MLNESVGVEIEVLIVNVVEKDGEALHVGVPVHPPENEGEAPVGRPATERVTGWAVPLTRFTAMLLDPELPCAVVTPAGFDREKSKGPLTVRVNCVWWV